MLFQTSGVFNRLLTPSHKFKINKKIAIFEIYYQF